MDDVLLLIGISLFAALVNGVTGFGYGLVAMPVLIAIMPVSDAVVVVNAVALFACAYNLWSVREHVSWRETWPVLGGAVPAAILGVYALKVLDEGVLKALLGVTILFGCVVALWSPKKALLHRAFPWGYVSGALGGIIGGALATGGPPVVLYSLLRGWQKGEAKAVLSAYFALITVWRLVLLFGHRVTTWQTARWGAIAIALVPSVLSSMLGHRVFRRMSAPAFRYATLAVLVGMGVKMVVAP